MHITITTLALGVAVSAAAGCDDASLEQRVAGNWISAECEEVPQPDGTALHAWRVLELAEGRWQIAAAIHTSAACDQPLFTLEIGGDVTLGRDAPALDGAIEAEFARDTISLIARTAAFTDTLTATGCTDEAWQVDVAQDITAGGCLFIPSSANCPREYDLVSLERDDALRLGARPLDGDLCSAGKRPTELGQPLVRL